MNLGLCIEMAFARLPFEQRLAAAAKAGFQYVEMWFVDGSFRGSGEELAAMARRHRVKITNTVIGDFTVTGVTGGGIVFSNQITRTSGTGNITLAGNGTIQAQDGSISLLAGNNITVAAGAIRTMGGGNVDAEALAGNINTGSNPNGYAFSASANYTVSSLLGGISTAAGGNASVAAGGNSASPRDDREESQGRRRQEGPQLP